MLSVILPLLVFAALALAVVGGVRRVRLWRRGRPAAVPVLAGLAALPRRYLVDLHDVVARDKVFANTHIATGGGFVAAAVLMVLVQWPAARQPAARLGAARRHRGDVLRCAAGARPPPGSAAASVARAVDAPAEEPDRVRFRRVHRHRADGRHPARGFRRLGAGARARGGGRVGAGGDVLRHDLGRADEAMQLFMPWFFFNWHADSFGIDEDVQDERTIGQAFLDSHGKRLEPLLQRYLEQCCAAPLSFYDIVSVRPGDGFVLRDILTDEECYVTEHSGSAQAQAGKIVFGILVKVDHVAILEACAPIFFPPIEKFSILELRQEIHALENPPTHALLREYEHEMLAVYHEIFDRLQHPPMPKLVFKVETIPCIHLPPN